MVFVFLPQNPGQKPGSKPGQKFDQKPGQKYDQKSGQNFQKTRKKKVAVSKSRIRE